MSCVWLLQILVLYITDGLLLVGGNLPHAIIDVKSSKLATITYYIIRLVTIQNFTNLVIDIDTI